MGEAPDPLRQRRPGLASLPGAIAAGRLLRRAEIFAYWLAVAPLIARLPARLGYRAACWRGELLSRCCSAERSAIEHTVRSVLGDELGSGEAERVAREVFRSGSCDVIDVMRLRGRAQSLGNLVEIRGREHLDAALAGGKGAILCSAHFGSHMGGFSVLHASGFPLTTIGRWWWDYLPDVSPVARRFWVRVYARRVLRHRQRPNIEPWPGRVQVAVQAAAALRGNEVVMICSDAPPLGTDQTRVAEVPFLGRQGKFLPGVVTLAQLTGAPVHMAFIYRSADYRHQVLEISPPVPLEGGTAAAFGRCVAGIEAAIRTSPAQWHFWAETDSLKGLLLGSSTTVPLNEMVDVELS